MLVAPLVSAMMLPTSYVLLLLHHHDGSDSLDAIARLVLRLLLSQLLFHASHCVICYECFHPSMYIRIVPTIRYLISLGLHTSASRSKSVKRTNEPHLKEDCIDSSVQ
jgi:hypothetical protein